MKLIADLSEKIDEELEDAEKYIDCAINMRETDPSVAKLFYTLSLEEMKHADMLHNEVVRVINEYKVKMGDPPETMMFLYNYLHNKQIEKSSKIKIKQSSYK